VKKGSHSPISVLLIVDNERISSAAVPSIACDNDDEMALIPTHSRYTRSAMPVLFAFVLSCMLFYGYSVSSNSGTFRLSNPIGSGGIGTNPEGSNSSPSVSVSVSIVTLTQTVTPTGTATRTRSALAKTRKPPPTGTPRNRRPPTNLNPPIYKPAATDGPAPVLDPFPLLALSDGPPPPIPEYNVPRYATRCTSGSLGRNLEYKRKNH